MNDFLLGLGCGLIVTSTLVLADTARQFEPIEVRLPTYTTPDIAQCNKELWLRIKDGCDE